MKKQIIGALSLFLFIICPYSYTQNAKNLKPPKQVSVLFSDQKTIPIKLSYSNKEIKKLTNDSTYMPSHISFQSEDATWKEFGLQIRVRGNFRLKNCYFPPIKLKINKLASKGTVFEGNKKLKLVLPCSNNKAMNDYIVKEFMAYKLYEIISPYHFNTRMAAISFAEKKGNKTKNHELKGFFIEDDKKVANRHGGKMIKRTIHPLNQEPTASVRNSLFQYMIGNTDFSTAYQHNEKLLYINPKRIVPIPYDFDMSGLVNTSYSVVSSINNEELEISSVKERLYRGFQRDLKIIQQVRKEFMDHQLKIMEALDSLEPMFDDKNQFKVAKNYILEFYDILINDSRFDKEIIDKLRTN